MRGVSDHWVSNVEDRQEFIGTLASLGLEPRVEFDAGVIAAGKASIESTVVGDRSGVFLPVNNALTPFGHVASFLEEIGPGVQHVATRVDDLIAFVSTANALREITGGRGFEFLDVPRGYYGFVDEAKLAAKVGGGDAAAAEKALRVAREKGFVDEFGLVDLDVDRAKLRDAFDDDEALVEALLFFRYDQAYKVLGNALTEEQYVEIVRNRILVDKQGDDGLLQIFTTGLLKRSPKDEAPFLEFIQRVCDVDEPKKSDDDDDDDDAGKKKVYLYVHQSTPTRDAVLEPTYDPAIIRFAVDVDELQKYTQTARRQVAKSFFSVPGGGPAASDDDDDDFGERLKSENDELSELRRFCDEERTAQALVRRCVGDDRRTSVVAFRRGDSSLLFPRGEEEEEEEENDEVGGKEGGGFREKSPSIDVRRGACRQERTDQRVAVCVAGQRRTFLSDAVQRGFAEHVGGDESYHFFLALDIDVDPDHALTRLPGRAVRGVWSDGGDDDVSRRKDDCPAGTANHRFLLPMARRLAKCFLLISDAETRRPRYDYVLRLRPDHVVLRPLPAVEDWLRQAGDPDVLLYDDEVALGPRASASAILKGPSTTYADCPGLAEWRTACGDDLGLRLREDHSPSPPHKNKVPCCPMNLIRRFLPAVASSSSSASTSSSSTVNHHHHSTSRKQQQQQNRTLLRQCRSPRHPTCVLRPCDIDLLRENGKGAFSCVPQ